MHSIRIHINVFKDSAWVFVHIRHNYYYCNEKSQINNSLKFTSLYSS